VPPSTVVDMQRMVENGAAAKRGQRVEKTSNREGRVVKEGKYEFIRGTSIHIRYLGSISIVPRYLGIHYLPT
jgi:hypothetical protein